MEKEAYLVADIGESKTRVILLQRENGAYRLKGTAEAETTLDTPELDVTAGLRKATKALEKDGETSLIGKNGPEGARLLCSSGNGGGLYMMVAGVTSLISGESAQRAALGAGARLIGVFSRDDPRPEYRLVENMRETKPDLFLLAGGTDGGAVEQVKDMAATVRSADIKPRFGDDYRLPVIYAGNVEARAAVTGTLTDVYATRDVENVRPDIERENLGPVREAIYDSYMEHVIAHSPGYGRLAAWVARPILPTQAAIGNMLYAYAERRHINLLAVNVGGSTTDTYSVYRGVFNRSLDAEAGLTYGAMNVLKTVGVEGIAKWLPEAMDERSIRNMVGNLMLQTHAAASEEERKITRALAREAIRLSVEGHKEYASRLKGTTITRTVADMFMQDVDSTYLDLGDTQVIVGMGPAFRDHPAHSAALLLDSLQPLYTTELYVDEPGLTPHAGMLLEDAPEAAHNLYTGEALKRLATCICPAGKGEGEAIRIRATRQNGKTIEESVAVGAMMTLPVLNGETCEIEATAGKGLSLGKGVKRLKTTAVGGVLGIIIDARGRPLKTPEKRETIKGWVETLTPEAGRRE